MKIHYLPIIDLAINIAKYLRLQGETVYFLDSKNFSINYLIKKEGFEILYYKNTFQISNKISKESDIFKLFKIRDFIKNDSKLINELNSTYKNCYETINNVKLDRIILFNGELDIESYVTKDIGIKTWYLDDGHLPDSYQMNLGGPNSKADYTNINLENFLNFNYKNKKINKIKFKIKKIKIGVIGYFLWGIKVIINLFYNKLIIKRFFLLINQFKYLFLKKKIITEKIDYKGIGEYIFFPLQVNNDSQIQINSEWKNNYEVLDYITKQIKNTNYKLIIKPHPFESQKMDYNKYHNNKNVFVLNGDLNELINNSKIVITVNSSVGFQAIKNYKKTIILGDCFYKNSPLSILNGKNDKLINSINKANILKINKKDIDIYINHFKNNIFLPGSARNQNISYLNLIFFEKLYERI